MVLKTLGECSIRERAPNSDELQHEWKKHKWLYKEKVGGKNRYFYTEAAHQAFLLGKKGKKAANPIQEAMANSFTDRFAERIVNRAKKSKLAYAILGGLLKNERDGYKYYADQDNRTARIAERAEQMARAQKASVTRKMKNEGASRREIRAATKELRKVISDNEATRQIYDGDARRNRSRAASRGAAYNKTTLGQAEARVRRNKQADSMAKAKEQAQDRHDAAVAAAQEKKKGKLMTTAASVHYQRDFIAERKKKREKKG